MSWRKALQRGAPLQRNVEWGVGFVWLCRVWQSVCRSCVSTRLPWVPPPPTYFADDRSRVKFSLLQQGPFSGLLQVWHVPVSHTPSSNAHFCAWVPQAAGDASPSSPCPCSLLLVPALLHWCHPLQQETDILVPHPGLQLQQRVSGCPGA